MSRDALVVGINKYNGLSALESPAKDAEAIAQLLEKYGNFRVRRLPETPKDGGIRVAQGRKVLLKELKQELVKLFLPDENYIPDTALLYFSGHGWRESLSSFQEGFLVTSDVNFDLPNYGLSLKWLRGLLQESPVRQQIVWLDCCHSGELFNFQEHLKQADPGNLSEGRDRSFIAASRGDEAAYAQLGSEHSLLTQALLKGLDPNRYPDGRVTNYTLRNFIEQALKSAPQRPIFEDSAQIILTGSQVDFETPVLKGVCPYKGLSYFDFDDEDPNYFYGRDALTNQLIEQVREQNFLAVVGASGSGKSSVVRAGLLYQLKLGARIFGSTQWPIYIFRPGEHPLQSLAEAFLEPGLSVVDRAEQLRKAQELINSGAIGLGQLIAATAASRVVLVIDQFEECFTLCRDSVERQQFFECLLGAVERLDNKLCLVLTMRADFFGKCLEQDYAGLAKKIEENLVTVTPLNSQELEQAITQPAKQVGIEVEDELVTQMITDVEGSPGSLPLLQYTLTELWQHRVVNWLTLSVYNRLGGVRGTLQKRANEIYEQLLPEEKAVAKRIFLELTQLGEGTEDTRRQVLKQNLVTPHHSEELVEKVLQKLADAKLVVTSGLREKAPRSGGVAVVDVAHEALIRYWPLLHQWVEENREALRKKRAIEEAAQEWIDRGKPEEVDYLLRGARLAEAEEFLLHYAEDIPLPSFAQEFIVVSQVERDRLRMQEEKRRQRELEQERKARKAAQTRTGVAIVSTALVGAAAIFAFIKQSEVQKQYENTKLQAASTAASAIFATERLQLEGLIQNVKAGQQLRQLKHSGKAEPDTQMQVVAALRQAIYEVREKNRLNVNGHSDAPVWSVSFSPDGKTIASASEDKTVKLWHKDGSPISTLTGHGDWVYGVSFSPDGQTIASASRDKTVKLWHKNGTLITTLTGHQAEVIGVSFSPDGQTIASASWDKSVKLWHKDGTLITTLTGHHADVWSVSFSPDGQTIASASSDKTIKLWNKDGTLITTLNGHSAEVIGVSFSPDGQTIASASWDKTVKLWRKDGTPISTLSGHGDQVYGVSFSPDGQTIASASADKTVKLWHKDGTLITTLTGHSAGAIGVSFSPDGQTIASASWDKSVKLWHKDGTPLAILTGHSDKVYAVSFSPDRQAIASASADHTVKLWKRDGTLITTLAGHQAGVIGISFSPDGQTIASASWDKTVKLWNKGGTMLTTLTGHRSGVWGVTFSPNGQTIASASEDNTVKLWKHDGTPISTLTGHGDMVYAVSFSPDGQTIASASGDKTVKLWRKDGRLITTLRGHRSAVMGVSFSPDGQMIASASFDGTVKLWSKSGTLITTLNGHSAEVNGVSFSPDGQTIASASWDNTIKLWRKDGTLITTLTGHSAEVIGVSFSPDGQSIASASWDNTMMVWNLNLDDLLVRGCDWLRDYLNNPTNGMSLDDDRRHSCDGVKSSRP